MWTLWKRPPVIKKNTPTQNFPWTWQSPGKGYERIKKYLKELSFYALDICINMCQPHSIPNGAKILSFSWKHSALNSLPGNAAWFAGWMAGNQRSSHLGKVKIILICAPGRAMFFLYSYVLMFCFYVLMLNPGYFWIHHVITYVVMSLVYTSYLSSLWNLLSGAVLCIFDGGGVQHH